VPPAKLEMMQSAFEQSICRKLVNSGNANFANADHCSFRVTFHPPPVHDSMVATTAQR